MCPWHKNKTYSRIICRVLLSGSHFKNWPENYSLVLVADGMFRLTKHYYLRGASPSPHVRPSHWLLKMIGSVDTHWIPISSSDPPPNSSTRCSWGLGCTSQISDLTSCVKHQIALGHLNSESAEVKSWLSCIPSGPSPASSAECSSSLHIHRNKRQLAGIG